MTVRESGIVCGLAKAMAGWSLMFAVVAVWIGDRLTSKQWQYLFSVPGGKYFWVALFTLSAALITASFIHTNYRLRALGLFTMGAGCSAVATFYLMSPLIDPGLLTLGWIPWMVPAGVGYFGAAVNWHPVSWF